MEEDFDNEVTAEKPVSAGVRQAEKAPIKAQMNDQFPEQAGRRNTHEVAQGAHLARLAKGDPAIFEDGRKPMNFDKKYGTPIEPSGPDADLLAEFEKHFNHTDGFVALFNSRSSYLFTILVPKKFSNMDETTRTHYRVDARSTLLKPGVMVDQVGAWCKKVVAQLGYTKVR